MRQTGFYQKENSTGRFQPAVRQLQRKCACGQHTVGGGDCAECSKKQQTLQRSAHIGEQTTPREAPPIVHATLRSSGRPLDANTRALMESRLGHDLRPFVSWLGTLPTDSSFCPLVSWARALMIENQNMTVPPFFFAGPDDEICKLGNNFAYARFEDTRIRICPKTIDPARTNSVLRALILTHELFHAPLFQMDHPTPDVMNSEHCGSMGSFEAITNPYCMTNVIGHLAGGDRCVM
jgi:hypothetical protein